MLQHKGNKHSSVTFAKLFLDEIAALYSGTSLVKKKWIIFMLMLWQKIYRWKAIFKTFVKQDYDEKQEDLESNCEKSPKSYSQKIREQQRKSNLQKIIPIREHWKFRNPIHIIPVHEEKEPFQCDICKKFFSRRGGALKEECSPKLQNLHRRIQTMKAVGSPL